MDLFAKGTKNNPSDAARKEQEDFRAWQLAESERLQEEQNKVIEERIALMNSMSEEEWAAFLEAEAIENAKSFAANVKQYELR